MRFLFDGSLTNTGTFPGSITSTVGNVTFTCVSGLTSAFFNNPNQANGPSPNYFIQSTYFNAPLTLSVWVNTPLQYYGTAIGLRDKSGSGGPFGFQMDIFADGSLTFYTSVPNAWTIAVNTGAGSISANQWTHVALTITSAYVVTTYINGVQKTQATGSGNLPGYTAMVIGSSGDAGRGWHGSMYDLRLYGRALSSGDVAGLGQCSMYCAYRS